MENSFLVYYGLAPAFWIVVTITNRILGTFTAKLNQKTVGIAPSSHEGQWGGCLHNTFGSIYSVDHLFLVAVHKSSCT